MSKNYGILMHRTFENFSFLHLLLVKPNTLKLVNSMLKIHFTYDGVFIYEYIVISIRTIMLMFES